MVDVDALRGRFGKYHVLDKIAQGGMAEIYKVKTVGLAGFEKVQALKRILPSAAQQGRFIRSFIDEARIAVELSHRNIVQVFDFGKAEGDLYLAMELIEGQDLRSAMTTAAARSVRCPQPVAAYIISEVAGGLDYAHRKADAAGRSLGIVHCDMSPSNVMLSNDGYIKILDFGIARASFSSALERRRLRGKPRYMAPEQTRGDAPTAATDVFALGIIAWELMTGRALFGGANLRDILHEVRTLAVPHLRDEVPSVPAEMADAIAAALQRDPSLRGTAADLGNACLRSALASGPRGVAQWQNELERGSSPAIGGAGAGNGGGAAGDRPVDRRRRAQVPHRPSAISIDLRSGEGGLTPRPPGEASPPELPAEGAAMDGGGEGEALHQDTEAQFPWDEGGAVERRTATLSVAVAKRWPSDGGVDDGADGAADDLAIAAGDAEAVERDESSAGVTAEIALRDVVDLDDLADAVSVSALLSLSRDVAEPSVITSTRSASMSIPLLSAPLAASSLPAPPIIRRPLSTPPTSMPPLVSRLSNLTRATTAPIATEPSRNAGGTSGSGTGGSGIVQVPLDAEDEGSTAVSAPRPEAQRTSGATATSAFGTADPSRVSYPVISSAPAPAASAAAAEARSPAPALAPAPATAADALASAAGSPAAASPRMWGLDVRSFDSESAHEEAIDDRPSEFDMGAVASLVNRRRLAVVVALLEGGAADTLRGLARGLAELAYQRGGVVLSQGERALVLAFGLEVAGEDDVAAAMTWAVDAGAIAREAGADGHAPQLRIGGRAGATATAPADGPPQIAAEIIEEARALARQAQPDRPLFTGGAGRLSSALFTLREVSTKDRDRSRGRALEVVGLRPVGERDSVLLERRGRFVGRTRELAILNACQQRAAAEQRRIIAVVRGASGIGKSRLGAELVAQILAQSPQTVLMVASAGPSTRLLPFGLLIDFLQAVLNLPPARGRAARDKLAQRILRVLRRGEIEPDVIKAVVGDLERAMELRDGISAMAASELADLRNRVAAGVTVVRRCLRALRTAELANAHEMLTAIIVIENLHHADSASLEVMRHTMANREPGAELFLMTTQGEPPAWPILDEVIELGDLVGGELRALAVDRLGAAATALNVAGVIGRAGGTPLFIEELAAAAQRDGSELPGTARDVVVGRVDRLSPAAQTAVRYAAVIGETVRARFLEEVIGQGDIGEALEELVSDGLLDRRDDAAPESPEGELCFARGLFREVVYESLSSPTLRDAHARVGRLLVARFFAGREEPPALIALHLEKGGEVAAAAAFWLRAGRISLAAADAEAAAGDFTRCLELEASLGEEPPSAPSRVRRREALLGREEAQRLLGDVERGDADLLALEALCHDQPYRLADVENRRAQRQLRRGDHGDALAATLRAEQLARAAGDERLRAEALRLRGEVYEVQGQLDQALSLVAQAGTIFRRHGYLTDEIAAMVGTGRIHLLRAHYEAARDSYRPVIDSLQKSSDPWLERIVRNHLAVIEMCLGNFSEAMALAQRSIELCRRYGDRAREGDALSVTGLILSKIGLYDLASATFGSALDILGRTSSRWSRTDCLIAAGSCEVKRGQRDGLGKLDEAIAEARQLGARYLEASGLVARAEARLRFGEASAAVEDAEAGAVLARRATLVGCEIQGLSRQAIGLHQLGSLDRAAPLARRALGMLDAQGSLEGSEEDELVACGKVLVAAGELELGERALSRARHAVSRKLNALTDPSWRAAYAQVLEHRQLLRDT